MAWVFEGDADNDLHGALNDAVMDNCAYSEQNWTYPAGGHGAYQAPKILKVTKSFSSDRFQFTLSGFSVAKDSVIKMILPFPEGTTSPLLRTSDGSSSGKFTTTYTDITSGDWAGYKLVSATANTATDGLMVTINGAFSSGVEYTLYIPEITINDVPFDPYPVSSSGVSLINVPSD